MEQVRTAGHGLVLHYYLRKFGVLLLVGLCLGPLICSCECGVASRRLLSERHAAIRTCWLYPTARQSALFGRLGSARSKTGAAIDFASGMRRSAFAWPAAGRSGSPRQKTVLAFAGHSSPGHVAADQSLTRGQEITTSTLSSPYHNASPSASLQNLRGQFRRSMATATTSSRVPPEALHAGFSVGDEVQVDQKDNLRFIVTDCRKGGWYTVTMKDCDDQFTENLVLKRRAKDLRHLPFAANNTTPSKQMGAAQTGPAVLQTANEVAAPEINTYEDPVNVIDLDRLLVARDEEILSPKHSHSLFAKQCSYFATFKRWVVFTDLHCAHPSLNTCLQVLAEAYALAKDRNAGLLFLGDWWHHRGSVRFDCLNTILRALSTWEIPMIMIPGNHDQVTFNGCEHGLTPLQNAYWIRQPSSEVVGAQSEDPSSTSFPGVLVFTEPTKFLDGLFIPHIRDISKLEKVLGTLEANSSQAIFVHADVTGAYMNNHVISEGGISPAAFPPHRPIFSGHFHKPHVVQAPRTAPGVAIQYIGSPYQTSLSEAGQAKELLLLDAANRWQCCEAVPLHIGRKHFRITATDEFFELAFKNGEHGTEKRGSSVTATCATPGDRVVIAIPQDAFSDIQWSTDASRTSAFELKVKMLRNSGVQVEIVEAKPSVQPYESEIDPFLDDTSPQDTLLAFLAADVRREKRLNSTAAHLFQVGSTILDEISNLTEVDAMRPSSQLSGNVTTKLVLDRVQLSGFCSFKGATAYELSGKGLVLIRGANLDGGYDSNGSGKTTLAMSVLWALTGSSDPRPSQDGKSSDVVNHRAKVAKVCVEGSANSINFKISREKTARKSILNFQFNGNDETRQSVKETQFAIDEQLSIDPAILSRIVFHGQFSMNGLLESTDGKMKEELASIAPLTIWNKALLRARERNRLISKEVSQLEGMIAVRLTDIENIREKCSSAKHSVHECSVNLQRMENQINQRRQELGTHVIVPDDIEDSIAALRVSLDGAIQRVSEVEADKTRILAERDLSLDDLRAKIDEDVGKSTSAMQDYQALEFANERARNKAEAANSARQQTQRSWGVTQFLGSTDALPIDHRLKICPTCGQDLHDGTDKHSRQHMERVMQKDIERAHQEVSTADDQLLSASQMLSQSSIIVSKLEKTLAESRCKFMKVGDMWRGKLDEVEQRLCEARAEHAARNVDLSNVVTQLSSASRFGAVDNQLREELSEAQLHHNAATIEYDRLMAHMKDLESNVLKFEADRDSLAVKMSTMSALVDVFGVRGIQSFVVQNSLRALQICSQPYLNQLSNGQQKLDLALDDGDRIARSASIVAPDGEWIKLPLSALSGGQWRRCSLALTLGFGEMASRRGRMSCSLLVLDEPLTHLDASGRERFFQLLRGLVDDEANSLSTILVILQDLAAEEWDETFDSVDEVRKKDGSSYVVLDN